MTTMYTGKIVLIQQNYVHLHGYIRVRFESFFRILSLSRFFHNFYFLWKKNIIFRKNAAKMLE